MEDLRVVHGADRGSCRNLPTCGSALSAVYHTARVPPELLPPVEMSRIACRSSNSAIRLPYRQLRRADPRRRGRSDGLYRRTRRRRDPRPPAGQGLAPHASADNAPPRRPHRRQPAAQAGDGVQYHRACGRGERIPGIDETVAEGDTIAFGNFPVRVLETPGHTIGHVSYWIPEAHVAFTGDTLFAMGAAASSKATPRSCGPRCRRSCSCRETPRSTAATSTRPPTRASP